jgi:primosomal protein N' (replication factor Y)
VFTPLPRLGLVIVDEEHDDSYKQQDGFRYNARDLAVYRARQHGVPVVLGTATPSLESLRNALAGRYQHLHLGERAGSAALPQLQLVDMRMQAVKEGFAQGVVERMRQCLEARQQVLVFLNRRGFAPLLQCQDCGWIAECTRCERSFTLHQSPAGLRCHRCEASKPLPRRCPGCGGGHLGGIGMGTERSEAFLRETFEDFPVLRIDRDTTRAAGSLESLMDVAHSGVPCVLLGTQMLAKGHHFPRVTLVVILDADSGLFSADFRSQENFGQLLIQVAGRAGRGEQPGTVLIQSYHPAHPALQRLASEGYAAYARSLLEDRHRGELPPFTHLVLLRAEASDRELPLRFLDEARNFVNQTSGTAITCFGPLPSPAGKKAGRFRAQLILQAGARQPLHRLARQLLDHLEAQKSSRKVRWSLDVDPLDFS